MFFRSRQEARCLEEGRTESQKPGSHTGWVSTGECLTQPCLSLIWGRSLASSLQSLQLQSPGPPQREGLWVEAQLSTGLRGQVLPSVRVGGPGSRFL